MTRIDVALSDAEYRAAPGLSQSGMKDLLAAPAVYRYKLAHPVIKREYDFGHAAHALVLGAGPQPVVVDADSWRTKAAKDRAAAIRADGGVPLLLHEWDQAVEMADALHRHETAHALLSRGTPEVSFFWERDGIPFKGRADWITDTAANHIIADYKTTTGGGAAETQFSKAIYNYGYHIQAAHYLDGMAECDGLGDREARLFVWIVQEKTPPYLPAVYYASDPLLDAGRAAIAKAIGIYRDCTATDTWPGYPDYGMARIDLPTWAQRQYEWSDE